MIFKTNSPYFNEKLNPFIKVALTNYLYQQSSPLELICLNMKDNFSEIKEQKIQCKY